MALTLFFDPLVALRAVPLVSSTCSLLFAYFTTFFAEGVVQVFQFLGITVATSLMNMYLHTSGPRGATLGEQGAYWWYAAAAGLTVSHLLYTPLVAPPVYEIHGDKPLRQGEDVNGKLDEWLRANWWRMLTTDLGAWVAAALAVGKSFSVSERAEVGLYIMHQTLASKKRL